MHIHRSYPRRHILWGTTHSIHPPTTLPRYVSSVTAADDDDNGCYLGVSTWMGSHHTTIKHIRFNTLHHCTLYSTPPGEHATSPPHDTPATLRRVEVYVLYHTTSFADLAPKAEVAAVCVRVCVCVCVCVPPSSLGPPRHAPPNRDLY